MSSETNIGIYCKDCDGMFCNYKGDITKIEDEASVIVEYKDYGHLFKEITISSMQNKEFGSDGCVC